MEEASSVKEAAAEAVALGGGSVWAEEGAVVPRDSNSSASNGRGRTCKSGLAQQRQQERGGRSSSSSSKKAVPERVVSAAPRAARAAAAAAAFCRLQEPLKSFQHLSTTKMPPHPQPRHAATLGQ